MIEKVVALAIANIPAIACVVGAAYVAGEGLDGWGWFLFAALLLSASIETTKGA